MSDAAARIIPIERSRVADRITDDLRMQIARGDLPPGAKLPTERTLAQRYGVSSATIREAIRGLTTIGLLQTRHGSGSTVSADEHALIAIALEFGGPSCEKFRAVIAKFAGERRQVVAALRKRDREAAREAVERYHRHAMRVIGNRPGSRTPGLSGVLQSKIVPELLSRRRQ